MKHPARLAIASMTVLATVVLALNGCASPASVAATWLVTSARPLKADAQTKPSGQLSASVNDFGLGLLKATVADSDKGSNVIISPLSVDAALSMTVNGATGETDAQMRSVLRTNGVSAAESNQEWASLLGALGSRSSSQTLDIADAMWARKGIAFKQPFLETDRDFFGAGVSTLDFQKDDVPGAINSWVSKNTHGMITKMIDKVPPNAILYLANAVYFKGQWVSPFQHEATAQQSFTRADGSKTQVQMMNAFEQLPYAENAALQATKLLYKGGDSAFYVMLPKPGVSLAVAAASLEGTGFSGLKSTMDSQPATQVTLGLPKLDTDFSTSLKRPLEALGMPLAFDANRAQFADMADMTTLPGPIYIDDVLHKTKVKVDEKGTVAAAATVVEMATGSAATTSIVGPRIICDRPYLFAIVDEKTGTMLFLGEVNDPTK